MTPSGKLILKAEFTPRIGDEILDKKLRKVGVVFDIFGPVKSPYVSVKPQVKDPTKFVGQILYARVDYRRGRIWRKRS